MPSQSNKTPFKKLPVIEFEGVSFSYSNTPVLSQVSFCIHSGEFVGLIGPNGGGKTTLLKLILGFLKPSEGTVQIFDKITNRLVNPSSRIAYVPQSNRFDKDFPISVEEVVLSGLLSHLPWYGFFSSKDREAARRILVNMELSHLSKLPFGTLSGGQAQRVLIARALVSEPQLLLLDEPTASVDNQAEADIYAILKKLKGQMSILMVTHDLGAAIDQVERVLCVQGKVISLRPDELCKHFAVGLYHMPLLQPTPSNSDLP